MHLNPLKHLTNWQHDHCSARAATTAATTSTATSTATTTTSTTSYINNLSFFTDYVTLSPIPYSFHTGD